MSEDDDLFLGTLSRSSHTEGVNVHAAFIAVAPEGGNGGWFRFHVLNF